MNEQSLSGLRRELLILLAARLDGAQYVWSQHRVIAEKLGATSAMVKAIEELDLASAALDEPEQALLGFGKQVIESGNVTDEVFERCSRHRSEEHTSELQSLMRISYAVFCLKKKKQ